jgi:hypothetical protein
MLHLTDTLPDGSLVLHIMSLRSRRTASQDPPGQRPSAAGYVQFQLLGFLRLHPLLLSVLNSLDVRARRSEGTLEH